MRKRVINGRINNVKGIQRNKNELLESILWIILTEEEPKWIKTIRKYMKYVSISFNDIHQKSQEYLKQFIIKWDLNIWKAELEMETTLQIYTHFENNFGDEEIYDNMSSSNILNKAITHTLQLNDRNRHTNKLIVWYVIKMKKKISTTLFCTAQHTKKRGVTVHTYNIHIYKVMKTS